MASPIIQFPSLINVGTGTASDGSTAPPPFNGVNTAARAAHGVGRPPVYYRGNPIISGPYSLLGGAPTQPAQPPQTYQSVYGNEPLEFPEGGNVAPSTDPYAYIDPTTGQVLPSVPGTGIVDTITAWIQANPILALGLAAGAVWLLMEFMGGGGSRRRR